MWLILVVLCDLAAAPPHAPPAAAATGPRVEGRLESGRRVAVRGAGFEPGEPIELVIDDAAPHASIACRGERSATVKADARGAFTARVRVPAGCGFFCGAAPSPYVVWADRACGSDCRQGFTSPAFACWK
ncbi:MAG TPA: neocarzinostatin apoprotein domain-containing protein [Polyangia bacterium]|nr:neocarzinostatin apoprotein domain-containing protein [Polyangia bacterium]